MKACRRGRHNGPAAIHAGRKIGGEPSAGVSALARAARGVKLRSIKLIDAATYDR